MNAFTPRKASRGTRIGDQDRMSAIWGWFSIGNTENGRAPAKAEYEGVAYSGPAILGNRERRADVGRPQVGRHGSTEGGLSTDDRELLIFACVA
jgi:hypothetical protein